MLYDCFTYFNEADLLEIRLNELDSIVDKFIICESTYTHAGNFKGLNFDITRYPKFNGKITYLVDDNPPNKMQIDVTQHAKGQGGPAWKNENHQRDYLINGLRNLKEEDNIMISDLDEIPSIEGVIKAIKLMDVNSDKDSMVIFKHRVYYYMFNYWALDYVGSKIMSGKKFKFKMKNSPQFVREYWNGPDIITLNSGWHFGWLGGVDKIKYKFKEFAHQEYTKDDLVKDILKKKEEMIDMWDRKLYKVKIDCTFPKYLVGNKNRFKEFIDE